MEKNGQSHGTEEREWPERLNEWGVPSSCFCWEIKSLVVSPHLQKRCIGPPPLGCVSVSQSRSEDILADFAHQLRQPLSTLETLAFYLDLIAKPESAQVHEQLRRMHAEIAHTDQVLLDGLCTLRAHFSSQGYSVRAGVPPAAAPKAG